MKRSDFHYDLPAELIAQYPGAQRTGSRLLHVDPRASCWTDRQFTDIEQLLQPGDLLVMNNTRVIPARLYGRKASGGKLEVMIERVLDQHEVLAQVRASKSPGPGTQLEFEQGVQAEVVGREGMFFHLRFNSAEPVLAILQRIGHIPLPPYITRDDERADQERYQTVYAQQPGAVAAPTAGLHFDEAMLERLKRKGVQLAFVTLHVGAGTYQPVRVDDIAEHVMHKEWIQVSAQVIEQIQKTKAAGQRVIAVGTTSVRSLESAARGGDLQAFEGDSDIFITPGYSFKVIDGLITNFHLPESTLLMLVCALGGYETMMTAYAHAVEQRYRFFSYGDAMLIL